MATPNTHYGAEAVLSYIDSAERVFFLGIGGVSMCSLSEITHRSGKDTAGYDRTPSPLTARLSEMGISISYEEGVHVRPGDAVVYTVAIAAENPDYREALRLGLPLISRADYLGAVMSRYRRRIGVSGMHGKSTTTAMLASVCDGAEVDPTVFAGSAIRRYGSPCKIGGDEYFVFEACEYMDSFLDFYPTTAVVLNIEPDHLDYFSSLEQIRSSFAAFLARTELSDSPLAVLNADDEDVTAAAASYKGRKVTFGMREEADYRATAIRLTAQGTDFDVHLRGAFLCHVHLGVVGEHFVCDALAALTAACENGIAPEAAVKGLALYEGADRRMERKGELPSGAHLYEDYAHHPTEIRASLAAARKMGYRRILCAFQSHTYSRTATLYGDFITAFADADILLFAPVYAARETNVYGLDEEKFARDAGAELCPSFEAVAERLRELSEAGDMVILMGAGDINQVTKLLN